YFNTFYNAQSYYKDGLKLKDQRQATQAKGKFDKAIEKSALVISRWPRSAWVDDATFLIGMSYYQSGQYDKAVGQFEQLVLAFPHSGFVPEAQLYRGLALLDDREYGVAGVVLNEVRERYPKLRDAAAFSLADAFYEREEFERAVDSLGAFAAQFPRSKFLPTAVEHLAAACFKLGRCAEAEKWYLKLVALTRQPKPRSQAMLRVAACRLEMGNNEQAAKQARDVLGSYKELDDEANLLLGRALAELGRDKEAIDAWSNVRGTSEIGAEAFFRIGKYYEELKEFAKARAYYDSAKSRRADSDHGVLAVKRLSLLDALAQGDSAGRAPAESRFLLAEVHNLNLGEYDEAMRLYQEVHDSFPDTDWAAKALFAKAWILKYEKHDSLNLVGLLEQIIDEYSETEYADESRRWLGLPVPKRAPKGPPPESLAVKPDTGIVRPESLPGQVAEEEEELVPAPEKPASPPEPPGMSKLRPTRPDEPLRPGEPPHPGPPVAPKPETAKIGPKPDTPREK
ncbi:tetratricopeptide repeat protein, partial [candidate division WOR-3 bacterium]|nr:tetratricopeptide repeat protein [candidate division WOR-3 bacterium]